MNIQSTPTHSIGSTTLADLVERILDKGIVIAGDIKINLVQVELLTIQIRLLICSVDRAKEIGMDWWTHKLGSQAQDESIQACLTRMEERLANMEMSLASAKPL